MKTSQLCLLIALSVAFGALPGFSRASEAGDYVAVHVPDVKQAVAFFRDTMNCNIIGADLPALASEQSPTLMTCGRETIIEISQATAASGAKTAHGSTVQPLILDTEDAAGMTAWLHARHMHAIGSPTRLTDGADAGKIAVTFLTPWGQPLELISRAKEEDLFSTKSPSSQVAVK